MTVTTLEGSLATPSGARPKIGPPPEALRANGDFAKMVADRWTDGGDIMRRARRDYWLNLAFYLGEQWLWWSAHRNMWMPMSQSYSPLGVGRVRLTVNRFGPNLLNLMGRMVKSELPFEVTPSDSADDVVDGARRGEKVLAYAKKEQGWESLRFDALLSSFFGGTSAVMTEWDAFAGAPLRYDEATDQPLSTGDTRLRALNVNEFCLQPNVREYRDARWGIMGICAPPSVVQEWYELDWQPRPDANTAASPIQEKLLEATGRTRGRNLTMVLCYYERPSRKSKGVYGCVVNGATVYKGAWPFPFDDLNFTIFRQKRIDGRYLGTTLLNDAMPIQVAYNFWRSLIQEHGKHAANARLIAPWGAFQEEDVKDSAGSILWYSPDGSGAAPAYLAPAQLGRWVINEADNLRVELDEVMHVHDISRGQGFSRASTQSLAFLAEQDDSALGHVVMEQKQGWERIASQVLKLYGSKATETRTATLRAGPGLGESVAWSGKSLAGQYNVVVPQNAVEPQTHVVRAANAKDLWDRKIITDPRVYSRMVGLPPDEFEQLLDADAAKAHRENFRIAQGRVEIPEDFDDHAVHISEHNRWRCSDAYKFAEADVRAIMDDHVMYHEHKVTQEFAKQVQREQGVPGSSTLPQANQAEGSNVPVPAMEARAMALAGQPVNAAPPLPGSGVPSQAAPPPNA